MGDKIEESWAVYGWFSGAWGIGKIIEDSKNTCYIRYWDKHLPECWDSSWVHKFKTSLEAINYFWENYNEDERYFVSKEKVIEDFIYDFPEERKNLEKKLLSTEK